MVARSAGAPGAMCRGELGRGSARTPWMILRRRATSIYTTSTGSTGARRSQPAAGDAGQAGDRRGGGQGCGRRQPLAGRS
jgi:hypothetical protein